MMRLALALILLAAPLRAETEVDVELFLAVDVSRSMTPAELEIQRRGYAAALASPEVIAVIEGSLTGQIALTYVEWAGVRAHSVVVPWTLIAGRADAEAVAAQITARFDEGMRRTSISGALAYAAADFENNGFRGLRRVIDISGDGPNNQGPPVTDIRDRVLAEGITINGLPLMTMDAFSSRWGIEDLDVYYTRCVIGGPGAFVLPVHGWDAFGEAVKRKLLLEIAGLKPRVMQAQYAPPAPYDCLVGEKLWERNRGIFDYP
jgi:hypothetical protein